MLYAYSFIVQSLKAFMVKIGWKQYIVQNIGSFSACLHVLAPIVRKNVIIVYGHG